MAKTFVLLDNQVAVGALKTGNSSSCLGKTCVFHDVAKNENAEVRWVPGHSKINENEEADAVARVTLQSLPHNNINPEYISLVYLRRLMHNRSQESVDNWWSNARPSRYQDLDLLMRRRKPPELALSRRLLYRLIAARTGHGDFAFYHRRFKHNDVILDCEFGLETSPTHFIRCRKLALLMRKLRRGKTVADFISQFPGPKCLETFQEWSKVTGYFEKP